MTEREGGITRQQADTASGDCLSHVTLDERLINPLSHDSGRDRKIAIYDLLQENHFKVVGGPGGPYKLHIDKQENRLILTISANSGAYSRTLILSRSPFRRIMKDYDALLESYNDAIRHAPPSRIEAIDMGRRGLHDEGSRILQERLEGKVIIDFATARRLFTLICAVFWKR
ncbi:MAG: hypothetical protein C0605_06010 [Hyphomicrobiales bacterium]|nr:MAG: hypothetical protein C0605_06010 [Hyphomicrobiales bacterium]